MLSASILVDRTLIVIRPKILAERGLKTGRSNAGVRRSVGVRDQEGEVVLDAILEHGVAMAPDEIPFEQGDDWISQQEQLADWLLPSPE